MDTFTVFLIGFAVGLGAFYLFADSGHLAPRLLEHWRNRYEWRQKKPKFPGAETPVPRETAQSLLKKLRD